MEELEVIVQRMMDAGEPEDNIRMVIEEFNKGQEVKTSTTTPDAVVEGVEIASPAPSKSLDTSSVSQSLQDNPDDVSAVITSLKNAWNKSKIEASRVGEFWQLGDSDNETTDIASAMVANAIFGSDEVEEYIKKYKNIKIGGVSGVGSGFDVTEGLGKKELLESIKGREKQKQETSQDTETLDIIESFKNGDIIKGVGAIGSAAVGMLGSAAYGIGTLGAGYFMDFAADNFIEYNKGLAKRKGVSLEELILNDEANTVTPTSVAYFQALAEVIGLGSVLKPYGQKVSNYVAGKAMKTATGKAVSNLVGAGIKEGSTEILQYGAEKYNNKLGETGKQGEAITEFVSSMFSQEGLESGLQGAFGGAGLATPSLINTSFKTRTPTDYNSINKDLEELNVLNKKYNLSRSKVVKEGIQQDIDRVKNNIKERVEKNNDIVNNLSPEQIREIDNLGDLAETQVQKVKELNDQLERGDIDQKQYTSALKGFNATYQDAKNRIQKIALEKDIKFAKEGAEKLGIEVQVLDTENNPEDQKIIDETFVDKKGKKISGVEGAYSPKDNKIYIDKVEAAKKEKVTVGSHELLHGILANAAKIDNKILEDFKKELSTDQINIVNKKLTDNYDAEYIKNNPDEFITQFSDAIAANEISFNENLFTKLGDLITPILRAVGFNKIKFETGRDVYNFMREYNKSMDQGQISRDILQAVDTKQQPADTKFSRSTLFEEINKLVPENIKTKTEFDSFVRSPDGAKLFNSIYNEGGAINNYIRQRATTVEESQKIIDNTIERVLNFNPESTRDDGSAVGIKGFTERIMADTRFAKLDAKKDLFRESEKAKQEQQLDSPQAAQVTAEESTATETTKEQTSKLRRDLGIKQGDDLYNAVKQTAKEIFGKDLDNVELKKLKAIVNKKARGSELFKDVAKLMGTEKAIDPQFLNKNILNILKSLPVSDLVKLERGAKGKKIFTKTGPRLGPIAAREAVNEGLLPKNTNIKSGPRISERIPVTLDKAKQFFTQKRKAGLVGVIAENLVSDAAPSVTEEINIPVKRRAEILAVLDKDPGLKFSFTSDLKGKVVEKLFDVIDRDGIAEVFEDGKIADKYDNDIKNLDSKLINTIYDLYQKTELKDINAILYGAKIDRSPDIPNKIKKEFKEAGNFAKDEDQQKALVEDIEIVVNKLGKEVTDFIGFDVFGFTLKSGLDPAKRKELRSSIEARKKITKENKIRKEKGEKLELLPKKVYSDVGGKYYSTLQRIKDGVMEIASPESIKKILPFARKMNKAFPLFQKFSNKNAKGVTKGIFAENTLKEKLEMLGGLQDEIEAANSANIELATYFSQTINKLYRDGKIKASSVLRLYQLQTSATGGLRALTRLTDITLENKPQLYNIKGEHLAPNANTMGGLAITTLNPKISIEESNALITQEYNNHNQWITDDALTKVIDDKLGKTSPLNRVRLFALKLSDLNNVYTYQGGSTAKQLVIQEAAKLVKRKNNQILPPDQRLKDNYDNTNVLTKASLIDQSNLEQEKKFSKSAKLSEEFNKIIEGKTGIGKDKTYSRVKAEVVGANKGRFNWFIPPSAEDFVGLLYKTLGKGKIGDSQMAWYKAHLLNPFARAMDNISRDRVALMNDFKELKKKLKVVPKTLKKKIPGENFTQEQAIRVYIWNKQGMSVPGMAQSDIKELTDFIENNPDLVVFANQLIQLQKGDQYAQPKEGWLAGNITTDLIEGINTVKRSKYLEVWQQNVDEIFSEPNLNKLEAAYGKNYRVALENILRRMKTGKNRSFGGDTLTGRVTDWLTNSIGAIMFFNTRSAVLQTISAINFINFSDNNIFKAGKAFGNQKQFWSDFKTLFNSDFLVERRDGLRLNVNEADIADMAKKGGVRGVISELLRLGFLPTQIADSFAIASGGSTFYRNRIKALEKQGMSKKEAETQAFQDFRETAEESQQSSRPDRISQQQAGPLGRVILAFANTPAQYARLIKKAASDLRNGRGDAKSNISKIVYYGIAQNLIFNALQQALFALAFDDEEEKDEKKEKRYINVVNGMADSILRGAGISGAIFSVLKNVSLRLSQESEKKSPEYQDVLVKEIAQISPPISSKLGKLRQAGRSYSWNKKEMMEKGWSIDNPAYLAAGQVIAATTNIPLDRAFKKIDNIRNSSDSDLQAWQRIASLAGWSDWELGIKDNEVSKPYVRTKRKPRSSSQKIERKKRTPRE